MINENIQQEREQLVCLDNRIVNEMEYKLSTQQLKLLRFMIKKIKPEDSENTVYSMNIPTFCDVMNLDRTSGKNYAAIKAAFYTIDSMTKWIDTEDALERVRWFDKLSVKKKSGTIEYSFSSSITPFLFDLIRQHHGYTKYLFDDIIAFESRYSIRLYEILKYHSSLNHGCAQIKIDALKSKLDAATYKRYTDFNRNVIQKAVEEINLYTAMKVKATPIKAKGSRAYTSIKFEISKPDGEEVETREEAKREALGEERFPF